MDKTNLIELEVIGISNGNTLSSYNILLGAKNGRLKLPIVVGAMEAQSIAIEIENIVPSRPLTHDLIKDIIRVFNLDLKEVIIYKYHEGVFHAQIVITNGISEHIIDSRTSDAISVALRTNSPIYIYKEIFEKLGVEMISSKEKKNLLNAIKNSDNLDDESIKDLSQISKKTLLSIQQQAIEDEDYVLAAKIRDEIQKRETNY